MEGITLKQLNQKINGITKRTSKWRDDIQFILVGCAQHAFNEEGQNVDPCTRLVKAVGGADVRALIHWIEAHLPAIWIKAEEKFRVNKSFKGAYDPVTLMAEPWWELAVKPKNVSSSIDVLDAVRDLVKRMQREVAAGKKTVAHKELIGELRALVGKVEMAELPKAA